MNTTLFSLIVIPAILLALAFTKAIQKQDNSPETNDPMEYLPTYSLTDPLPKDFCIKIETIPTIPPPIYQSPHSAADLIHSSRHSLICWWWSFDIIHLSRIQWQIFKFIPLTGTILIVKTVHLLYPVLGL